MIYWIHRLLHHPVLYRHIHKPHHKWLIPTPYASHAFHFFDGYMQSVPYHIYAFVFPLHRLAYLVLFVLVNCWSIFVSYFHSSPLQFETLANVFFLSRRFTTRT